MSRGIPGYPGGLPRGSAGEAGPVPPRPLPSPDLHKTGGCCKWSEGIWVGQAGGIAWPSRQFGWQGEKHLRL